MRRRYAEARRYDDRGTFELYSDGGIVGTFETSFERGKLVAFSAEVESGQPRRKDSYRFRDADGKLEFHSTVVPPPPFAEQITSVGLAIAAFLGVTMGASFYVPGLLLGELDGFIDIFDRGRQRLGEGVAIDGAPQLVIEVVTRDELLRMYVAQADVVIRRIELLSAEDGHLICRTDYNAAIA